MNIMNLEHHPMYNDHPMFFSTGAESLRPSTSSSIPRNGLPTMTIDTQNTAGGGPKDPPLRLLSLDGGGIRGYSMLVILQELMFKLHTEMFGHPPDPKSGEEPLRPCEVFDLIGGVGTGGLIALMLGRLRLDIETCKNVYVRMTKRVFLTDKRIGGVLPYSSSKSIFKASKLEEAIGDVVRECTMFDDESIVRSPQLSRAESRNSRADSGSVGRPSIESLRSPVGGTVRIGTHRGNRNAKLLDLREGGTKTFVTATFKGSSPNMPPALLRSYPSRKESSEPATIIQAARATCAIAGAFKESRIGQDVFLDEGEGHFNPTMEVLEEACGVEWPNSARSVGVLVSIGTGKKPASLSRRNSADERMWWEDVFPTLGDLADSKRRIVKKLEDCEETHRQVMATELERWGVSKEDYFRFNVDLNLSEVGMNEWERLPEVSTNTKKYLRRPDTRNMLLRAARGLATVERLATIMDGLHPFYQSSSVGSSPVDETPLEYTHDSHPFEVPNSPAPMYTPPADMSLVISTVELPPTPQSSHFPLEICPPPLSPGRPPGTSHSTPGNASPTPSSIMNKGHGRSISHTSIPTGRTSLDNWFRVDDQPPRPFVHTKSMSPISPVIINGSLASGFYDSMQEPYTQSATSAPSLASSFSGERERESEYSPGGRRRARSRDSRDERGGVGRWT